MSYLTQKREDLLPLKIKISQAVSRCRVLSGPDAKQTTFPSIDMRQADELEDPTRGIYSKRMRYDDEDQYQYQSSRGQSTTSQRPMLLPVPNLKEKYSLSQSVLCGSLIKNRMTKGLRYHELLFKCNVPNEHQREKFVRLYGRSNVSRNNASMSADASMIDEANRQNLGSEDRFFTPQNEVLNNESSHSIQEDYIGSHFFNHENSNNIPATSLNSSPTVSLSSIYFDDDSNEEIPQIIRETSETSDDVHFDWKPEIRNQPVDEYKSFMEETTQYESRDYDSDSSISYAGSNEANYYHQEAYVPQSRTNIIGKIINEGKEVYFNDSIDYTKFLFEDSNASNVNEDGDSINVDGEESSKESNRKIQKNDILPLVSYLDMDGTLIMEEVDY